MPPHEGKVSLILTVKNESATIDALLQALAAQTRPPDEVVIVDGGSTDDTLERVRAFAANPAAPFPIKAIQSPGSNIPQGRNIAVMNSSHPILASTDAGCRPDRMWLERLIAPILDGRADVAAGISVGLPEGEFQEVASHMVVPSEADYKSRRALPTARSLAYTRIAWDKAGGVPAAISMAEDTAFAMALERVSSRIVTVRDAIVYWDMRGNARGVFQQFRGYARGDGYHGFFPIRYAARYLAIILLVLLAAAFWYSPYFWLLAAFTLLVGLWLKQIRKVPRLNPSRLYISLKVAAAIEAGLTVGYLEGLASRRSD